MTKLILICLITLITVGIIYSKSTTKNSLLSNRQNNSTETSLNWKTFDTSSYTIQYPPNWEIEMLNSTNYKIYDPATLVHDTEPKSHQKIIYPEKYVTLFRLDQNPLYQDSGLSNIEIAKEYLGFCPIFTQNVTQNNKTTTILRCTDEHLKPGHYENIFYANNNTLVLFKFTPLKYAEYANSLESRIISTLELK